MSITLEEIHHLRQQFLLDELLLDADLAYLNVAAMGPVLRSAFDEAVRTWQDLERNPALHGYECLQERMECVRAKAARFVDCTQENMVITHSTTDGMNAVAQGLRLTTGNTVLTTNQEHPGGRMCWEYLKQEHGVQIKTIKFSPEKDDWNTNVLKNIVQKFKDAKKELGKNQQKLRVISVSHVTPYTGLRMPIQEIMDLGWPDDCIFLVDGAQAVGAIDVNVKSLGCHAYATCGHKWLMGPKGTGLLYLQDPQGHIKLLRPLDPQEKQTVYNHATGVRDIPAILGLGAALDCFYSYGMPAVAEYLMSLRTSLHEGLQELQPTLLNVISPPSENLLASPIITFILPSEINNEKLATVLLHKHRFMVKVVPRHIDSSLADEESTYEKGKEIPTNVKNGIRISPHIYNTKDEISRLIEVLKKELPKLKK